MGRETAVRWAVLLTVALLWGCASYTPSLVKLDPTGPKAQSEAKNDVLVYVEEYATREKCQRAFDTDLSGEGVLPLLVLVRNNAGCPYEVTPKTFAVEAGDKELEALTVEQAVAKAKRGAVGRALGWSMIVPIISIPVAVVASAAHTGKVNQQIIQDFSAKAFPGGTIMPNREISGFLFFVLDKERKDLSGLRLRMTFRNTDTGEPLMITLPLPDALISQ